MDQVTEAIRASLEQSIGLTQAQWDEDPTLAELIVSSPTLHNSVDLMEVFARMASQVRRQFGVRIRLPALPLEVRLSKVVELFAKDVESQLAAAGQV